MTENDQSRLLPRAYYSAPVAGFLASPPETILGFLVANSEMAVEPPQAPSLGCFGVPRRDAWLVEIAILKTTLQGLDGTLLPVLSILRQQCVEGLEFNARSVVRGAPRCRMGRDAPPTGMVGLRDGRRRAYKAGVCMTARAGLL
jgi:hypothetical protein